MKKNLEIVLKRLEAAKREISEDARRESEADWETLMNFGWEIEKLQRKIRYKMESKKTKKRKAR